MKRTGTKIFSLLLCAALFVGLTPAAASAADIPEGAPAFALNETVVAFGGREWYVIGDSSGGAASQPGHITLLAKSSFGDSAFRRGSYTQDDPSWTKYDYDSKYYEGSFTNPNDYNDSTLMRVMNDLAGALPSKEAALITARDIGTDGISGDSVNNQKLWPLSRDEYQSMGSISGDPFSNNFWLRSPNVSTTACIGSPGGVVNAGGNVSAPFTAVRPALHLNLSSVLFTSDASGANTKSSATVGSGLIGAAAPGGAIKFTMRDDVNLSLTCLDTATRSVRAGDTVSIDYSGAQTGANNYISCVIVDSGGNIVRYGKLGTAASGTVGFMVPLLADGSYTIKLFNEECNGDTSTDFASTPIAISMTVKNSGADGREIELRVNATHIQWRYMGEDEADWQDLIALSALAGADGADGREIELRVDGGYIQWRYVGGSWNNLMAVSVVAGPQGPQGEQGAAGANGVDGIDGRGGSDGQDGTDGSDGVDGRDGNGILSITKTGSQGNVDTYTIDFTDGTSTAFTVTNGKDGVGVASAAYNENDELVFTLTDGKEINLGLLLGDSVLASRMASGEKGGTGAVIPIALGAAALLSAQLWWLLPLLRRKIFKL